MNQHITPEINTKFVEVGCTPMAASSSAVDYYHCKMDLYFHYCPDVGTGEFHPINNSTEVVIVVDSDTALSVARLRGLHCEVIKLHDIRDFILYRAYSTECGDYRSAKRRYSEAKEFYYQAFDKYDYIMGLHERNVKRLSNSAKKVSKAQLNYAFAEDEHLNAAALFWSHPKP
ncbi:hypothetical protein GJ698_16440 [Pseudoduganella sp. FT26W]|uniref:Uncharacterized protein n=1 Tax=Duganella aquatilis TaxID=2666082 RepID=A0A844DCR5_9BURK|nr:hypothetical protein [Duganella aquatilis]MRW85670.1 hypothetical protein [Duganella aquatilis]